MATRSSHVSKSVKTPETQKEKKGKKNKQRENPLPSGTLHIVVVSSSQSFMCRG